MPEEAFALSPISARASLPSEADYEAIREAFMETARGRWFLGEYAKRNRNADTRMVLDAVSRIEQSIAAQKQAPASSGLVESLSRISALINDAKAAAAQALPNPGEVLAGARQGARVTREVASALRDCGADTRICDLLDAQVAAIEAGHRDIAATGARDAVLATFDRLTQQIVDLASSTTKKPPPRPAPPAPPSATVHTMTDSRAAAAERPPAEPVAAAAPVAAALPVVARAIEPTPAPAPAAAPEPPAPVTPAPASSERAEPADFVPPAPPPPEPEVVAPAEAPEPAAPQAAPQPRDEVPEATHTAQPVGSDLPTLDQIIADESADHAATAYDIAVLDMVAQEMAAPDPEPPAAIAVETSEQPAEIDAALAEIALAEAEMGQLPVSEALVIGQAATDQTPPAAPAPQPEPAAAAPVAVAMTAAKPAGAAPTGPATATITAAEPASLGAELIARGMVRKPLGSGLDPLAAIRRMTQAEKLAFFS
ncbi:MAG TPA: hypothetical protein VGC77_05965 [Rhodopseudomonas sp.]|uniref:hypothetical protein n=1 Tax=Rhodopseudomonas sp. TaxID=1078 RepID=UPI002ED81D94